MDDRKLFGSDARTITDAARELQNKQQESRRTTRLSVDHAVFSDARQQPGGLNQQTLAGGLNHQTLAGGPPQHVTRTPSPHIVRGADRVSDPGATISLPAIDASNPADSPMVKSQEAPDVSLTQHALPPDRRLDPRLILVAEPDSARAARFRILRHHLMDRGRPQVVVVSSPMQGEGKTTCAVNLALALAECNRARVLLVDASVRRPQLASVFRFVPPWCFAEQLSAHRHQPLLPWGVVDIPDLWLHIAAINPQIEQNQLLDAPAFAIAMERLRLANYDHIVIDAPAVLGSAEVNLIQDAADGVLLTAWAKKTTARALRTAVEQLSPTKIVGTILLES